MHLPLNAIDAKNLPPLWFILTEDVLNIVCGGLWTAAYCLYIKQSFRDKSYGMPIFSLCSNLGWELIYGLVYPPGPSETIAFVPWVFIDLGIAYATIKFGPHEFSSKLISSNITPLMIFGITFMLLTHAAFVGNFLDNTYVACFWAGYACQVILSWESLAMLMFRGSTRGQSLTIWFLRWTGTLCATAILQWRYYWYPGDYQHVGTPFATFLFVVSEVADVVYPWVFRYVERNEGKGTVKAA